MSAWIARAEALEAQVDLTIALHPDDYRSRIDRMCWRKHFAWWPVKTMASRYGAGDGKWRWLMTVERHVLEPVYRDIKEAAE